MAKKGSPNSLTWKDIRWSSEIGQVKFKDNKYPKPKSSPYKGQWRPPKSPSSGIGVGP